MSDLRASAMSQHLDHQHREQVRDLLMQVLAELAEVNSKGEHKTACMEKGVAGVVH